MPPADDCPEWNGQDNQSYKKSRHGDESYRRERTHVHDRLGKKVSVHDRLGGRAMLCAVSYTHLTLPTKLEV